MVASGCCGVCSVLLVCGESSHLGLERVLEANLTGVSWFGAELGPKHIELLRELVPNDALVAVIVNPNNAEGQSHEQLARDGAGAYTATFAVTHPRWEKLWGGRRRLWHLHRPYEPMEVAPWSK